MSHPSQIKDIRQIKQFILSGNAYFTLHNKVKNSHLTFRFSSPTNKRGDVSAPVFTSVLTGPDNVNNYHYTGTIWQMMNLVEYRHNHQKSRIGMNAPSVLTIQWLIKHINANRQLPNNVEFWHEGKCGRCARKLTDPESVRLGFGPECIKLI